VGGVHIFHSPESGKQDIRPTDVFLSTMVVDMRQVAAGVVLLLASSVLLLDTGVSSGLPLVLAAVASIGMAVGMIRSGAPDHPADRR
jgi:hypothetical protein